MSRTQIKLMSDECMLNVTTVKNDSADSVIVFLHGGPGSGAQPIMDLPALKTLEKTFSAVYFDQRGSGESEYDLSKEITIEQITKDVKCVVDYTKKQFKGKPVYLWGGSFGGLLTLLFLQKYPTEVNKAVISSPAIWMSNPEVVAYQDSYFDEVAEEFLQPNLLKKYRELQPLNGRSRKFIDSQEFSDYLKQIGKPPVGQEGGFHIHAMRNWINDCDLRESIKDIKIPTLFLQGLDDPICIPSSLIEAVEKYKNNLVSLKTFPNCGHGVFDDCKDEFCEACTEFYLG